MTNPLVTIYGASLGATDSNNDATAAAGFVDWLAPELRTEALTDLDAGHAAVCRYRTHLGATGTRIWELRQIDAALVDFYRWLGLLLDPSLLVFPATRLPIEPMAPERVDALMTTVVRFGAEAEAALRLLAAGLWVSEVAALRPENLRREPSGFVAEIRLPNWRDRDVPLGPACTAALDATFRRKPRLLFSEGSQDVCEQQLVHCYRRVFSESGAGKFKHKALRRTWVHRLLVAGMDMSVLAHMADGTRLPPHSCVLPGEADPFPYVAAIEPVAT